jgi:hypothetical protein
MSDAILRRVARDQWVRINGTPRVTVLVGGDHARRLWRDWLDAHARSAAEAGLLAALEATPATAGRFELNGYLSVRFGTNAMEVDVLGRQDRIAIEIDGYYHVGDLEAYRRDRRKDLLLQTLGFIVVRVLAQDVMRDARPAVNAICRARAYRRRP